MKKFKNILLFVGLIVGFLFADRIIALGMNELLSRVTTGTFAEAKRAMFEQKSEILILGSSRAQSHFDPAAIKQLTDLSCYNAGMGGQGYDYTEIITSVMMKRYSPKIVVLEVTPTFFDEIRDNNAKGVLLPFAFGEKTILTFLEKDDKYLKAKSMISQSFLFNSSIFKIVSRVIKPKDENSNGFQPIEKKVLNFEFTTETKDFSKMKISKVQWQTFINTLDILKRNKIKIVATISPIYFPEWDENDKFILHLKEIIRLAGGEFLDYSRDSRFMKKKELYYDGAHLLRKHATEFSKVFGADLNKLILLRTK